MVWVLKLVVHVEKFNGLFWGSNESMTSSVQVLETLFCKVDETHVTHEVVNTRRFAEAGLFFKLTSNTGSLGDSSDNTFAVLLVVLLVDSTPDSSGKIGGSSDGTGEVSQETEVLELETERLVSSIVVVVKFIVSSFDSVSVLNIGDIGSDFLDV